MAAAQRRTVNSWLRTLGFLTASGLSIACPGQLPCDEDLQSRQLCNRSERPDAGITAVAPVGINAATPIVGCARWPTLGAMDGFFSSRCGIGASCHGTGTAYADLGTPFAWIRLPLTTAKVSCKGAQVVNTRTWQDSVLLAKTRNPVACPAGSTGMTGLTMPPQTTYDPKTPVLDLDETRCLEGFLRALTAN